MMLDYSPDLRFLNNRMESGNVPVLEVSTRVMLDVRGEFMLSLVRRGMAAKEYNYSLEVQDILPKEDVIKRAKYLTIETFECLESEGWLHIMPSFDELEEKIPSQGG